MLREPSKVAAIFKDGEYRASCPCSLDGHDRADYHNRVIAPAKRMLIQRCHDIDHFVQSVLKDENGKDVLVIDGFRKHQA